MQARTPSKTVTLRGRVARVFYTGPKSSVVRLKMNDGNAITCLGPFHAGEQDALALQGYYFTHPVYGKQFQVEKTAFDDALTREGLCQYLEKNRMFKGVSTVRAQKMVEAHFDHFENVLTQEPQRMAADSGIPLYVIESVRTAWIENRHKHRAFSFLSSLGITQFQINALWDRFGPQLVNLLKSNPYLICGEVPGFGFKRSDAIALKTGTRLTDSHRLEAALNHAIKEAQKEGHCWVEFENLIKVAAKILFGDPEKSIVAIEGVLNTMIDAGTLASGCCGDRIVVADPQIKKKETDLARRFSEGSGPGRFFEGRDRRMTLIDLHAPRLNEKQREAVDCALSHRISLITGGAGSGKTFTVGAILDICRSQGLEVTLCAPTGKAAKRMEEITGKTAHTIHKLLNYDGRTFNRGPENPLETDILVVDEFSMVDVPLAWQLLRAVKTRATTVILVGDPNQLPPVGPGNVLRDLVNTHAIPTVAMEKIVRQAGKLEKNCRAILTGEVRPSTEKEASGRRAWYLFDQYESLDTLQRVLKRLFQNILTEELGFDLLRDVQVLTPTHKGVLGTRELNLVLQQLIQKKLYGVDVPRRSPTQRGRFFRHDKVMQTRNNYDFNIMNGATGFIAEVKPDESLVVDFDDVTVVIEAGSPEVYDLQLAYAITIHKSQGSEYECAIAVIHSSHHIQLQRNLFYTAVTRAKSSAMVLGNAPGIQTCATIEKGSLRKTFLSLNADEGAAPFREAS